MDINSKTSPQYKEFEFQRLSNQIEEEITSYPADELFYRGKLLPLQLPPRLRMMQKLLEDNVVNAIAISQKTPLYESCNISTTDSSHLNGDNVCNLKNTWGKKLKLFRQTSKSYLKSLFTTKSKCSGSNVITYEKSTKISEEEYAHRNSFSGGINYHHLMSKSSSEMSSCSSSSSSLNSDNLNGRRSLDTEMESSILGAIAHCKETQVIARKSTSKIE